MLTGESVREHLRNQIDFFVRLGLREELSEYDPIDTFNKAHSLIRSIEEFINISVCANQEDFDTLRLMSLVRWNPLYNNLIDRIVKPKYGHDAANRFKRIALESRQMLAPFGVTNDDLGYRTMAEAAFFYQAHRRHFVTILYVIPKYCSGKKTITEHDLLTAMTHFSQCYLRNITTLHRQLVLSHVHKDFQAEVTGKVIKTNYQLDFLEGFFTEPERVSITDPVMEETFKVAKDDFVPIPGNRIFSTTELTNELTLISLFLTFFSHDDKFFDAFKDMVEELVNYAVDDYFISIPKRKFELLVSRFDLSIQRQMEKLLTLESDLFTDHSNSYRPFIGVGRYYKSNVNLVLRFAYNYKNVTLNRNKRYQVKSGFLFEEKVKVQLSEVGFTILDVKRIKRKEFDVVTVLNDTIYNFQCKNNFVDITLIESNPQSFAAKNMVWVRYYEKSIEKEISREDLLINKYGKRNIRHFVISRFPVLTTNPSIILFKDLKTIFQHVGRSSSFG